MPLHAFNYLTWKHVHTDITQQQAGIRCWPTAPATSQSGPRASLPLLSYWHLKCSRRPNKGGKKYDTLLWLYFTKKQLFPKILLILCSMEAANIICKLEGSIYSRDACPPEPSLMLSPGLLSNFPSQWAWVQPFLLTQQHLSRPPSQKRLSLLRWDARCFWYQKQMYPSWDHMLGFSSTLSQTADLKQGKTVKPFPQCQELLFLCPHLAVLFHHSHTTVNRSLAV